RDDSEGRQDKPHQAVGFKGAKDAREVADDDKATGAAEATMEAKGTDDGLLEKATAAAQHIFKKFKLDGALLGHQELGKLIKAARTGAAGAARRKGRLAEAR